MVSSTAAFASVILGTAAVQLDTTADQIYHQDDSMSLLQLSAAKKHIASDRAEALEETEGFPQPSILPCHTEYQGNKGHAHKLMETSIDTSMKDRDLKICRFWGDVHPSSMFLDKDLSRRHDGTPYIFAQWAVSRDAAACSGKWEIQKFQLPCGSLGCQAGAAIRVGSMRFELYSKSESPYDVVCFMGRNGTTPCPESGSHGRVWWSWNPRKAFCLEYKNQVALTIHKFDWGKQWDTIIHVPKSVCTTKSDNMCGGEEHLVNGQSCNDEGVKCPPKGHGSYYVMQPNNVTSEQMLFSTTALNLLCRRRGDKYSTKQVTLDMCNFPDEQPTSNEEICEKNGNKLSDVEETCKPLKKKYLDFYEDCLTDECALANPQEEKDIEMIAAETSEANTCMKDPCNDEDICDAIALSLDEVHSNLGGKGPDTGAEEMRFSSVATIDGVQTDLVVVSSSKYKPKKPENNVVSNGIGVINLDGGQKVSLTFSLVKTGTNEEVSLDTPFKLAFVDVDKGKAGNTETITVCGAENIYMREVSALKSEASSDDCYTITAGMPGTGADNPTSLDLTEEQKTRSFDIAVKSGSFTMELEVKEKKGRMSARNFMFGGQSVVGHC